MYTLGSILKNTEEKAKGSSDTGANVSEPGTHASFDGDAESVRGALVGDPTDPVEKHVKEKGHLFARHLADPKLRKGRGEGHDRVMHDNPVIDVRKSSNLRHSDDCSAAGSCDHRTSNHTNAKHLEPASLHTADDEGPDPEKLPKRSKPIL